MVNKFDELFNTKNVSIEYTDGSVVCLSDFEGIKNGTSEIVEIPGYTAQIELCKSEDNIYSLKAKFTPKGDLNNKIYKVTNFSHALNYDDNSYIYLNYNKSGVVAVKDLPDNCICENFISVYNTENTDKAFTLASKLPAKFKSGIAASKTENLVSIKAYTIVPYSFEGEIVCQEWNIYPDMPTSCALIKNVETCHAKKELEKPIGWSTWDYYFTSATEDDVKENVDFIANDEVLSKKVRYIALDDGWQQREGDWRSGCRFPSGLKSLVDYIKEKGFEAGIWVAPTRLHFLSGTVMRRYEFLACNEYGDPVQDEDMYVLDPTHPDGEKFIRETFSYLADCGFTFYKLDFVSNLVTYANRFYDKTAGPFDVLKKLFNIVRETVPEGSHIMGCSLPYGIGPDVADSRRTGLDIHNTWAHTILCTSSYIPQFAAGGTVYRNDLDYLLVRGIDTSDDPKTNVLHPKAGYYKVNPPTKLTWRTGREFNYNEAKMWCDILLMSGSSLFMGDCLPKLNETGLKLVRKTLEEADFTAATPVFEGKRIPEIWLKKDVSKLYVFNFSDEKQSYLINFSAIGLKNGIYSDIFTDEEYTIDNELKITLDAHSSISLKLK